ncbi:HAD family hydrolase [Halosegnis marinus]|uniref:HAD family hydrolase n=1 Tax=Halosegnis marinus TaxID=3034023 RepID=A0ABD5ZMG5_9EURY|nr:HAD family hydrolase [Halosegnis sp. DT85]
MAVVFALGALVSAAEPDDPAAAIARELRERGVEVPDDWAAAYAETHVDPPDGAAVPHHAHVARALASRGVPAPNNAARRALVAAFAPDAAARDGALEAVLRAREHGPVALLSDTTVPEYARRALLSAGLRWRPDTDREPLFDAVVTGVSCGWLAPHPEAFAAVAEALGVEGTALTHVARDPEARPGVEAVGGSFVDARARSLGDIEFR